MRPPRDVYEDFLSAHHRAVEVGGLRPELRCNRAQGLHMFERRLDEAEAELLQVMEEKPAFGTAYVRAGLLYGAQGRLDEALAVVERGFQQEPLLPTLPATEVMVRLWRREFERAVEMGENAVTLHPYLQISRANYAQALEHSGRLDEALAQYQLASLMSPDLPWIRALEGTCLAKLDRRADADTVLEELQALRRTEFVDALYMGSFMGALGLMDEAFLELERACDENSAFMYALDVDPRLDVFRADPRFARLRSTRAPLPNL
jgi:tetratricopeptide (TPR) repeat protein